MLYLLFLGPRKVLVTGNVILPADAPVTFPAGSCLYLFIQKNIQCLECDNPKLAKYRISNPRINNKKIPFQMTLTKPERGGYTIQAVLNNGWCGNDKKYLRYEDYHNDYAFDFELQDGQQTAQKNVDVVKYKSKTTVSPNAGNIMSYISVVQGIVYVKVVLTKLYVYHGY